MKVYMPEENPRRRTPPRGPGGRFRKRKTSKRRRTRRLNPTLATVGLNPRKRTRRRYTYKRRTYRRRSNPAGLMKIAGVTVPGLSKVGFGLFGVVGTQSLPNLVLPAQNTGAMGYLLELGALVATSMVAGMIGGVNGRNSAAVGGGIRIAYRIAHDFGLIGMIPGAEAPPATVGGYIGPKDVPMGRLGAVYGRDYSYVPQPAQYGASY